jgi:hypothetical protein
VSESNFTEKTTWFVIAVLVSVSLFSQAQQYFPEQETSRSRAWGTFETPFAATSPWNSRPIEPSFGDATIPPAQYAPAIESGKWSTGVFETVQERSKPVTITGAGGRPGLWRVDDQIFRDVILPRWPESVRPASGADGHAEVVDTEAGVVHSFWKLRDVSGKWGAEQYAWTRLDGTGWGDPAHPMQGARAAGVPALGGLIRTREVNDGEPLYRHALAMSLPTTALSPSPAYVFPATSADTEAQQVNTGSIPEGALLMLPPAFNTKRISDVRIRKIAETLKTYGAYVVDRNDSTGFVVFAEIGCGLDLHARIWNANAVADLEQIRVALRPVVSARIWLDGNDKIVEQNRPANLVSMRGPWSVANGNATVSFDSWSQRLVFERASPSAVVTSTLPVGVTSVTWARPVPDKPYEVACLTHGGARCRLVVTRHGTGHVLVDTGELGHEGRSSFVWPAGDITATLHGYAGTPGSDIRILLTRASGR